MDGPMAGARLTYGLCVQTSDLIAAVRAFTKVHGPTRALDLIKLRRVRGTLNFKIAPEGKGSAAGEVPAEVWDLVWQAVVDVEVEACRLELMAEWTCEECVGHRASDLEGELTAGRVEDWETLRLHQSMSQRLSAHASRWHRLRVWEPKWIDSATEIVHELCQEPLHDTNEWNDYSSQFCVDGSTKSLLNRFGLNFFTSRKPLRLSDFNKKSLHTVPLGIPFPAFGGYNFSAQVTVDLDEGSLATEFENSNVINIPRATFSLPKNADARFSRLLQSFHIRAVDLALNGLEEGGAAPATETSDSSSSGAALDEKAARVAARTPRWMLSATVIHYD